MGLKDLWTHPKRFASPARLSPITFMRGYSRVVTVSSSPSTQSVSSSGLHISPGDWLVWFTAATGTSEKPW